MSDLTAQAGAIPRAWKRLDKAWGASALIVLLVAVLNPGELAYVLQSTLSNITHTGIFILFAVLAVGYLKASGAEATIAKAFEGQEVRMIVLAAAFGGLSPFCSCEVIPFIAALLAMGAPLSAVMAFWLASPLMDPPMFLITSGTLGVDFAVAKAISAVALGLFGGFGVKLLMPTGIFNDILRPVEKTGCGCGSDPFSGKPVWAFWRENTRIDTFRREVIANALFLGKWLLLAYLIEALMIRHVPAEWIGATLGGDGLQPIVLGALLGGPAYLNGYAAVPLISGLIEQGMSQGAAMAFVLAGGVSCIPAAIAVWALVKPRVFFSYLGFAFAGSLMAGMAWGAYSAL